MRRDFTLPPASPAPANHKDVERLSSDLLVSKSNARKLEDAAAKAKAATTASVTEAREAKAPLGATEHTVTPSARSCKTT